MKTPMEFKWTDEKAFFLHPAEGNTALIPAKRSYRIRIFGSTATEAVVLRDGKEVKVESTYCSKRHVLTVELADVAAEEKIEVRLPKDTGIAANPVMEQVDDLLNMAEIGFTQKEILFALLDKRKDQLSLLAGELQAMELDDALRGALLEIVTAHQS